MADRWCGNKKGVGKTGGILWKDKEENLVNNVDNIMVEIYVNMKIIVVL